MCKWLLAGFLAVLAGCAGEISGKVFLDKNSNNIKDEGEPGLGRVLYRVTVDGAHYKAGSTGDDGTFTVSKESSGVYCVVVESSASEYMNPDTFPLVENLNAGKSVGKAASSADDDSEESSDKTCMFSADCPPKESCKNGICSPICSENKDCDTGETCYEKTCVTICDTNKDCPSGQTCNNEKCGKGGGTTTSSGSTAPLPPTRSLQNCARVEGYAGKATIDVPVAIDLPLSIATVPQPSEKTVKAGEKFSVEVYYPRLCKLLNLKITEHLSPADKQFIAPGNAFNLPLLQEKTQKTREKDAIVSYDLTADVMIPAALELVAEPEIDKDEISLTLEPKAICPDNKTKSLHTQKIIIKKERHISLSQSIEGEVELDKTLTLKATVKNSSPSTYADGGTVTVSLPEGSQLSGADPAASCKKTIQQVECEFDKIDGNSSEVFYIKFQLTQKDGKIRTELKLEDEANPIIRDINFSLP